jgi:hypothetical protein
VFICESGYIYLLNALTQQRHDQRRDQAEGLEGAQEITGEINSDQDTFIL